MPFIVARINEIKPVTILVLLGVLPSVKKQTSFIDILDDADGAKTVSPSGVTSYGEVA